MPAHCWIEGHEVDLAGVAKRVMNFGLPIAGARALPYSIRVPVAEFTGLFESAHARLMREFEADEPDEQGDEVTDGLRAAGFPSLSVLMSRKPRLFEQYVARFFFDEVLDGLARAPAGSAIYQLNSLTRVVLTEDVTLYGGCYRSVFEPGASSG